MTTNQPMSGIHESSTCTLGADGGPCELCAIANESEHRQRQQSLKTLAEAGVFSGRNNRCGCPLHQLSQSERTAITDRAVESEAHTSSRNAEYPIPDRATTLCILTAIEQDGQYASITVIRAAIADVIDGGCTCDEDDGKHPWELEDFSDDPERRDEDLVNLQRERFLDAISARIIALQSPPFNMDAALRQNKRVDHD